MDRETKTRIEYEHQFFNFSSDSLIDSYKGLLRRICESGVNGAVKMLKNKLLPAALDAKAIEEALDEMGEVLKSNYTRGVDYAITKNETKIRDCFRIPDHLYLPEDRIVATVEGVDREALDAEIHELKQELKKIAFLIEEGKQEQKKADETISALEDVNKIRFHPLPDL